MSKRSNKYLSWQIYHVIGWFKTGVFMSIKSEKVCFEVESVNHIHHLFCPESLDKKAPAVIVIHEWWGLDDHAIERAKALAQQGYVALAVDMYGEAKRLDNPKEAYALSSSLVQNFALSKQKILKALEVLKNRSDVDSSKILAIGYCFGGTMVLNMARAGADLALVSSFHGALSPPLVPASPETFKAKVLVFNGEADSYVPKEHVEAFKKEMSDLKANYQFKNYPGVVHSFTNKKADENGKKFDLPLAYNQSADEDSWNILLEEIRSL